MRNIPAPDPPSIDVEAEAFVHELSRQLTTPVAGECLLCHVDRMLTQFGCDETLRFALSYRDAAAPTATALTKRLWGVGGFCDCEIFMNGFAPIDALWTPSRWERDEHGFDRYVDAVAPQKMPPCRGARRGSTRPCALWRRRVRGEENRW